MSDKQKAKASLDYIFCGTLLAVQRIDRVDDETQKLEATYACFVMTISWLQRIYSKFNLEDKPCTQEDDSRLKHTQLTDLQILSTLMESFLEEIEENDLNVLAQGKGYPAGTLDRMIGQVYANIYQAQTLMDVIIHELSTKK